METEPIPMHTDTAMAMHLEATSVDRQVMSSGSILNPTEEDLKQAQRRWAEKKLRRENALAAMDAAGITLADFPGPRQVASI